MKKGHILIVEDEALLYKRLRKTLVKEHYNVDEYAPSVREAIACINRKKPDVVLLDIDLEGTRTGLDLGKLLYEEYHIPFIYITGFSDDETFYKGLHTNHEQFIVKTKPILRSNEVIRAVQTVLRKAEQTRSSFIKEGVLGLVEYLTNIRVSGNGEVTRVPVRFNDIAFFTSDAFINENEEKEKLKQNYLWFLTRSGEYYFFFSSLTELLEKLPHYFVRVNESYIVNLSPSLLDGRINGSRLSVMKQEIIISDTYKKEVKNRFKSLYD